MQKKYITLLMLFVPMLAWALECAVCGENIHGRYVKTANADYCSKECYLSTLPECDHCGERCQKQTIRMMGKTFCSKQCMYKVFRCSACGRGLDQVITVTNPLGRQAYFCPRCRQLPGCYFCAMPTDARATSDGRKVCRECQKTAVYNDREIRQIFNRVRKDLGAMFGYDTRHHIALNIVNVKTLNRESKSVYMPDGGRRIALMRYSSQEQVRKFPNGRVERKTINEKCQIFVLRGVPRAMLYDALAHELTHDHIRHNVGKVTELANEEGFCELVAALYNRKLGNAYLNKAKDKNNDPVYGGGYRKMLRIYQRTRNLRQTLKYVR